MSRPYLPLKSSLLASTLLLSCAQGDTATGQQSDPWIPAEAALVPLHTGACAVDAAAKKLTISLNDGEVALLAAKGTDLTVNGVACLPTAAENKLTAFANGITVVGPMKAVDIKGVKVMVDLSTTLPVGTELTAKIKVILAGNKKDEVWVRATSKADKVNWVQDTDPTSGAISLGQVGTKNRRDVDMLGAGLVSVFLGAEKDVFVGSSAKVPLRVFGDVGDDTIQGGTGHDLLDGGEGSDTLSGGLGDDLLIGGDGSDTLDGQQGCDGYFGGNGLDWVTDGEPSQSFDWIEGDLSMGQCNSPNIPVPAGQAPGNGGSGGGGGTGSGGGGQQVIQQIIPRQINGASFSFSQIPAGMFQMGASPGDTDAYSSSATTEFPVHQVTISHTLWVSTTEITQAQWSAVASAINPSVNKSAPELPVENVTWYQAAEFCNQLSEADGLEPAYIVSFDTTTQKVTASWNQAANGYRLPTEAEWEYFARAGSQQIRYDGPADDIAWHMYNASGTTHAVGQKQPNPWGLFDIYGNVDEWTWDYGHSWDYGSGSAIDPTGPLTSDSLPWTRRVRGGSFMAHPIHLRSSARGASVEFMAWNYTGFRIVRNAP